jgi:DNA topoisomerase VI subunit B
LFERYIPEVADSLSKLTGDNKEKLIKKLQEMIKKAEIQKEIMDMETLKGEADEDESVNNADNDKE